jgi:hypothetical protein
MTNATQNEWCRALGIDVPRLEVVKSHRAANTYALLIVALLETGAPMTLEQVAERFEAVGVASAHRALARLKQSKPGRPPVYRDRDTYSLDPHDSKALLWTLTLDLQRPKVAPLTVAPPRPEPVPTPDLNIPLSVCELDEAWREARLFDWSGQRVVVAVLDAQGGPLTFDEITAAVLARTKWSGLGQLPPRVGRRGDPVAVLPDGRWELADASHKAVLGARRAVRERPRALRQRARLLPDPIAREAERQAYSRAKDVRAAELAQLRRVVIAAHPPAAPCAIALLDPASREIHTLFDGELENVGAFLSEYDVIAAMDVRALLRVLRFDPGQRRLADLGPPQKTYRLNRNGRTLKLTTALLVQHQQAVRRRG